MMIIKILTIVTFKRRITFQLPNSSSQFYEKSNHLTSHPILLTQGKNFDRTRTRVPCYTT